MNDPASLQNLHDIVMPPPVDWWPPAPGWYVLSLVFPAVVVWGVRRWYRKRRVNAYRRAALNELAGITELLNHVEDREAAMRRLPGLVKRTALAAWPRREIARLSGWEWRVFLDRTGGTDAFTSGSGRLLPLLAYGDHRAVQSVSLEQVMELTGLIQRWIKDHREPKAPSPARTESD